MKIISVVGARPNFIKIAPFIKAIKSYNKDGKASIEHILVHTGQHYDDRMSKSFFEALKIPSADINLGIGSGTHAEQVGYTMIAFEKVLMKEQPDWVVVVGDVNATLACSVTAKKLNVRVCHIEAGLRSGDMQMPEEINRLVTDRLADLLLVPDRLSAKNLLGEGCTNEQVVMVGNIMIDTFDANLEKALAISKSDIINRNVHSETSSKVVLEDHNYAVVTLHRPSNVDDKETLKGILNFLANGVAEKMPIIWPVHPRTEKQLKNFNLWDVLLAIPNIQLVYPLGYHDLLQLNMNAKVMLTDSGGLQEECTVLGTKCITMRWNTERPITLKEHGGVSVLVGNDLQLLEKEFQIFLKEDVKAIRPEMWDGKTALRCVDAILKYKS